MQLPMSGPQSTVKRRVSLQSLEQALAAVFGQRLAAVAWLTIKAAFRYRLVSALSIVLVAMVVLLPMIIKDDGTARGFTQILLTYTLGLITALLGFATLWLACGTLARDIEESQMQMVVVKPIARWQIWLGKWIGIMLLNVFLLTLTGTAVFALLKWRAGKLSPQEQAILKNEVLVARGSAKEPIVDIEPQVEQLLQERRKSAEVAALDVEFVRAQIREQIKASEQVVPPEYARRWVVDLSDVKGQLQDQPLFLRVKFYVPPEFSSTIAPKAFNTFWEVGPPETPKRARREVRLAAETFHELEIPANMFDEQGKLTIDFRNYNPNAMLFSQEEGMEVLYRESGFGVNYIRGLGIIFCWLSVLAALGLAAASFLSFPVAAFMSLGVLIVVFSGTTISTVVSEGTITGVDHETGIAAPGWLDAVALPVFKVMLILVNVLQQFSPIDSLSSGRSITWSHLFQAMGQITLLMGGLLAALGITIFNRRELAQAQSQQ